ncbi:hypothetical protein ACROYT_G006796 [Oculina patagonica]
MNLASLGCLTLLLLTVDQLCYSNAEQEEDPDYIFSGDAVLFTIKESTSMPTSWLACSKNDCNFSKRQATENFYTHGKKVFHIYAKGRLTTSDPIRYGDEVALFYRVNDDGDGLWLGCAPKRKRCGLGTCPGLPHLNHWMWNGKYSCAENKFVVTESTGLQNATLSGQPVRIEHQIKLIRKIDSHSITSGKRHMGENSSLLTETPFLDNFGNWVISKGKVRDLPGQDTNADDTIVQCCGSEPYLITHGICCNEVLTPFYPLKANSRDALECCADQGFNKRTSFCYSCGKTKHVLPLNEKQSWSCCKEKEIYRDEESRCCEYGVEKGTQLLVFGQFCSRFAAMAGRKAKSIVFRAPADVSAGDLKSRIESDLGADSVTVVQALQSGEYLVELATKEQAEQLVSDGFELKELHIQPSPPTGTFTNVSIMGLRAYIDDDAVIQELEKYGEIKSDVI